MVQEKFNGNSSKKEKFNGILMRSFQNLDEKELKTIQVLFIYIGK